MMAKADFSVRHPISHVTDNNNDMFDLCSSLGMLWFLAIVLGKHSFILLQMLFVLSLFLSCVYDSSVCSYAATYM